MRIIYEFILRLKIYSNFFDLHLIKHTQFYIYSILNLMVLNVLQNLFLRLFDIYLQNSYIIYSVKLFFILNKVFIYHYYLLAKHLGGHGHNVLTHCSKRYQNSFAHILLFLFCFSLSHCSKDLLNFDHPNQSSSIIICKNINLFNLLH